jgi:hypothetical protein
VFDDDSDIRYAVAQREGEPLRSRVSPCTQGSIPVLFASDDPTAHCPPHSFPPRHTSRHFILCMLHSRLDHERICCLQDNLSPHVQYAQADTRERTYLWATQRGRCKFECTESVSPVQRPYYTRAAHISFAAFSLLCPFDTAAHCACTA